MKKTKLKTKSGKEEKKVATNGGEIMSLAGKCEKLMTTGFTDVRSIAHALEVGKRKASALIKEVQEGWAESVGKGSNARVRGEINAKADYLYGQAILQMQISNDESVKATLIAVALETLKLKEFANPVMMEVRKSKG